MLIDGRLENLFQWPMAGNLKNSCPRDVTMPTVASFLGLRLFCV